MLKDLIIIGYGNFAKEMFSWASPFFSQMGYRFKGFLDDYHVDAFAKIIDYVPQPNDVFSCAIAKPADKRLVVELLSAKGAKFINIVHPSALIFSDLSNYSGLVIGPFVWISNNVTMANHLLINVSVVIGHDVIMGEYSTICPHCSLTGYVKLGEAVFVGSNACIIPGKVVGDAAIIGAGSAVMRDVPANVTVLGVPAKRLL